MNYRRWIGIAGVVLLGAAGAWADDAAECDRLYLAKQYKQAFPVCAKAAVQGDTKAQHLLGLMYANGKGVKQDHTAALKWWRKAAEQGDAPAQYVLGVRIHRVVYIFCCP